jgi:hypothetical protein
MRKEDVTFDDPYTTVTFRRDRDLLFFIGSIQNTSLILSVYVIDFSLVLRTCVHHCFIVIIEVIRATFRT